MGRIFVSFHEDGRDRQIAAFEKGWKCCEARRVTRESVSSTMLFHRVTPVPNLPCRWPDHLRRTGLARSKRDPRCHNPLVLDHALAWLGRLRHRATADASSTEAGTITQQQEGR